MPKKLIPVDHDPFKIDAAKFLAEIKNLLTETIVKQAEIGRRQVEVMHRQEERLIETLVEAINAPKRIVRDKSGRPVGVEPTS